MYNTDDGGCPLSFHTTCTDNGSKIMRSFLLREHTRRHQSCSGALHRSNHTISHPSFASYLHGRLPHHPLSLYCTQPLPPCLYSSAHPVHDLPLSPPPFPCATYRGLKPRLGSTSCASTRYQHSLSEMAADVCVPTRALLHFAITLCDHSRSMRQLCTQAQRA